MLAVSLLANLVCAGVAVMYVQEKGGRSYVEQKLGLGEPAPPNFAALGSERFGPLPTENGDVVFLGDSHVQNAPLADLVTSVKQRGIGGQTVADVSTWAARAAGSTSRRLVLLVGVNDALSGRSRQATISDYETMLDDLQRRRPDLEVVIMSVPPVAPPDANARVVALNKTLRSMAGDRGLKYVDLFALLVNRGGTLDERWTVDGVHLNADGYARAAPAFREAAGL